MISMCECLPIWGVAIVLYHVHTVEGRLLFLHIPLKIGAVWHTIAFKVSAFHYFCYGGSFFFLNGAIWCVLESILLKFCEKK